MNPTRTFWLREEDLLQPKDIGAIVAIDTYTPVPFQAGPDTVALNAVSCYGTLAGFSERSGAYRYRRTDLGAQQNADGNYSHEERPDLSVHGEKFDVDVVFADGRRVSITDTDWAQITAYRGEDQ